MSLEFEKLSPAIDDMVRQTGRRRKQQEGQHNEALARLRRFATSWESVRNAVMQADELLDKKRYRAAMPLHDSFPIDAGIPASAPPSKATILACDGSQIVPDRHAPFPYYLINTGLIAYYHGSGLAPDEFSTPKIEYPRDEEREEEDLFTTNSALVGLYRDKLEMESLAETLSEVQTRDGPTLAILDQRLLYWPTSGIPQRDGDEVTRSWWDSMNAIREQNAWLAGYIDRPGKRSVLTMLHTMDIREPGFKLDNLLDAPLFKQLADIDLYESILEVGERSVVFKDVSKLNMQFKNYKKNNEVCFFFLRTGEGERQLARVDIPMWVAENEETVAAVHALIFDQCQILGKYPYVITRADEIAVVSHREQEELEHRIALRLAEQGIDVQMTSKQQSKEFARSGKTRQERI